MSKHLESTQRVPYDGPKDSKILIVGEAPGAEEVGQRKPFVGKSGELLIRYLNRVGVGREEVRLANLCQYRPRGNKFELLLNSLELEEGIEELRKEVENGSYNVIIALGSWPLWYLTGMCGKEKQKLAPGTGISTWRGSRLPAVEKFKGVKVFPTYHPSYVLRDWHVNPIFHTDLYHAVEDSHFPELRYPEYEEYIDPGSDQLHDLVRESLESEWTSVDIETFRGGKFSCIGWAFKTGGIYKGVCITYKRADLWRFAKEVWESSNRKIFQYGTYDISFMRHFYQWHINGYYNGLGWDTYVASASILPDYPRGLDFLCSIYTRFPYYKEERKVWREDGDMMTLWKYNIKDTVATLQIGEAQMEEIKQLFRNRRSA